MKDIEARAERAKRGFLNPNELKGAHWCRAYAEDVPWLLAQLKAARQAQETAEEKVHKLEQGMTATGLGLTRELLAAEGKLGAVREYMAERDDWLRSGLWEDIRAILDTKEAE